MCGGAQVQCPAAGPLRFPAGERDPLIYLYLVPKRMTLAVTHLHRYVDPSYLGFYSAAIFTASAPGPTLATLVQADVLRDRNLDAREYIGDRKNAWYGPLLPGGLREADFYLGDYSALQALMRIYASDEKWGEDLPVFKQNLATCLNYLDPSFREGASYAVLTMEGLRPELLSAEHFFAYYVWIIVSHPEELEVYTFQLGED